MTFQDVAALVGVIAVGVAFLRWWIAQPADVRMASAFAIFLLGAATLAVLVARSTGIQLALEVLLPSIPADKMNAALSALDTARGDYSPLGYVAGGAAVIGLSLLLKPPIS